MFEKSYYHVLQDYIQSGCKEQLTPEEQEYYNALYAIVGIHRKYGRDQAINLLMHEPFNCSRPRAREMYNEAVNLFFLDDSIENRAHRNMIFEDLQKAAQVVLLSAKSPKDMEIYGNLKIQAWKVKQLDKEDPIKREQPKDKPIKVYTTDSSMIGIPSIDRKLLAQQIDSIPDISERDRERLKRDANIIETSFEEMLDDTQEKLRITDDVEVRFGNWVAQLLSIIMPWSLYWVAGRASAKTVQVLAERVQEVAMDCPGAPFAWVADTYSDLHKNVIPSLIDGLALLGWEYGTHYVINEAPPEEWKLRMYNICSDWRNTMVFYTGFNFTFISLDRMAIGAGRSYVGVFGDEVKYFPEEKFTNLLKAVRGFYVKYGDSVWYRSRTLTTDMPNPNHLGEYDWILKMSKQNDKQKIMLALRAGLVYNDTKKTYVSHLQEYEALKKAYRTDRSLASKVEKAEKSMQLAKRNMERWEQRWIKARQRVSLFFISSTYVNADILGLEWFQDEITEGLEGLNCNVLSIIPKLESSVLFYPNLTIGHFYADGYLNYVIDKHPLAWQEDCTVLRYLDKSSYLEAGMDSGNMLSMVIGQRKGSTYYVIKEFFSLPPQTARELADAFLAYFVPMKRKVLKLYYDRSMNNYKRVKSDMATQIKNCIEKYADGSSTGWSVQLMSLNQGNIGSNLEYRFMQDLMAGNLQRRLFSLKIDQYNCRNLKSEMEVTKTKSVTDRNGASMVVKEKTGDKLPTARLPKESTNLTDAFKYLMMRKEWLRVWQSKGAAYIG